MLQTILLGSPSIPTQPTTETIESHGQTRKANLATQSREAELHSRDRGWILRRTKNSAQNGRESISPPLPPTLTISETNFQNSLKERERERERGGGGYQEGFRNGPKTGRISHPSTTPKPKSHLHIITSSPNQTTLTIPHKNKNH